MIEVTINTSIVIVGGGPAGVCAALEASRMGIPTVLVHNRPVLGGNSSSEIRVWMRGATGAGNLFAEEMGIIGELKLRNLYENPEFNTIFWDEILLDAVLQEKNITLLLNTHIHMLTCRNGQIVKVEGVQQETERYYHIKGDYFIDASGDGALGELAGVPYRVGKKRYDYETRECAREILGCSILYYVKNVGKPVTFVPPKYVYDMDYIEGLVNKGGRVISEKQTGSDCWWFEYGGFRNTISEAQEIKLELKKLVMGVWNYIKNSGKYPEAANYTLEWAGNILGKRESRRMIAEYELSQQDILENTDFEDAAFYGGWYMDFHPAGGLNSEEENCIQIPVNVYRIPLQCLYNHNVPNLLFAGRIIGTEAEAFASTRIMNTCALSGQAAAVLAWKCLTTGKTPEKLDKIDVEDVAQMLLKEDMFIPGKKCSDDKNLAHLAKVEASSVYKMNGIPEEETFWLEDRSFLVVPTPREKKIQILMEAKCETKVQIEFYQAALPNRLCSGEQLASVELLLENGRRWYDISLEEGKENKFSFLLFKENSKAGICLKKDRDPGVLCGRCDNSDYKNPCVSWEDTVLYEAENVIDGYARPYGEPHIWCSEQEENSWITLNWEKKIAFDEIRIYLDPELSMEIPSSCASRWDESHKFTMRDGMPEQLIKDMDIEVYCDGKWSLLKRIRENYQRMIVMSEMDKTIGSKIRITVNSTWGEKRAQIYQISVYNSK